MPALRGSGTPAADDSQVPLLDAQTLPIWMNAVIFAAAAGFVWLAGTRLARYVDRIARKHDITQATAGMLLMGVITSLPEIANAVTSSAIGNPALAVNNLLGSAAINVLLLAVADALIGRDALTSVAAHPSTLMQAALCMLVLIAVAAAILCGDTLLSGVGLWALGLFTLSIGAFWLASRYGRRSQWVVADGVMSREERDARPVGAAACPAPSGPVMKTIAAAGVILIAGYTLSLTGDALAEQTGLGAGIVGFLLIGISTSLPEFSSIVSALRLRRHEMAIGEILGTNFVNVSLILLADAVYAGGPVLDELGRFEAISALLGASLVGIYLVGLLERRNPVALRMGYDSLAVLAVFSAALALLFSLPASAP